MRFKEAAVAGEFANWTQMFESIPQFKGLPPRVACTKCGERMDTGRIATHLEELHKYDVADGVVIQVNNQWWRRRGTKA